MNFHLSARQIIIVIFFFALFTLHRRLVKYLSLVSLSGFRSEMTRENSYTLCQQLSFFRQKVKKKTPSKLIKIWRLSFRPLKEALVQTTILNIIIAGSCPFPFFSAHPRWLFTVVITVVICTYLSPDAENWHQFVLLIAMHGKLAWRKIVKDGQISSF